MGTGQNTGRMDNMWTSSSPDKGSEATSLKGRSEQHLARKVFHVTGVALIIALYHLLERQTGLLLLGTIISILIPLDFLRRNLTWLNEAAVMLFGSIMRKEEQKTYTGVTFLLVGAFIVIFFFPKDIVTLSLIMLGLGDPISSIVGTKYGKDKIIGNKSLQGSLAGFTICTIAAAIYFINFGIMTERVVLVSLLAGLIGAAAELIPIGKIDDNFTIPVISSILLYGLFMLFGGF